MGLARPRHNVPENEIHRRPLYHPRTRCNLGNRGNVQAVEGAKYNLNKRLNVAEEALSYGQGPAGVAGKCRLRRLLSSRRRQGFHRLREEAPLFQPCLPNGMRASPHTPLLRPKGLAKPDRKLQSVALPVGPSKNYAPLKRAQDS